MMRSIPQRRYKEERNMKKLLAVMTVLAMVLSLAACGSKEASPDAAYNNYLKEIKKGAKTSNGTLTVAMSPDFAPMEFYDLAKKGDDAIVGFDVLLANYLAAELGMTLKIAPMSFEASQAAVQSGKADIGISGFSWMADRAENFELSDWYEAGDNETEQSIIVKKEDAGKFSKPEDFAGMKIGYQGASLQEQLVKETFSGIADIDNVYSDLGTAVEALKSGRIQALAVAHGNGESIIANAADAIGFSGFDFDVDPLYENNVCLIQKGNTELLAKVNAALAKAKEAGLYKGWYEACQIYAEVKTIDELGYDENGVKITEAAK